MGSIFKKVTKRREQLKQGNSYDDSDFESGPRRLALLNRREHSRSALELTTSENFGDVEGNYGNKSKGADSLIVHRPTPSDDSPPLVGSAAVALQSLPSPTDGAACCGVQPTNTGSRKSSPSQIRAFLTPPLMRKRKPAQLDEHGVEGPSLTSSSSSSLPTSSHQGRAKSSGFFNILKSKFDKAARSKRPVSTTSSAPTTTNFGTTQAQGSVTVDNVHHAYEQDVVDVEGDGPVILRNQQATDAGPSQCSQHDTDGQYAPSIGSIRLIKNSSHAHVVFTSRSRAKQTKVENVADADAPSLSPGKLRHRSSADSTRHSTQQVTWPAIDNSGDSQTPPLSPPSISPPTPLKNQRSMSIAGPFRLHVHLKHGHDLPAKDSCGTSDPYVKFRIGAKNVYRSKTVNRDLNPTWDEAFDAAVQDLNTPLQLRVYDYDWGVQDDFMGAASLDLVHLEPNKVTDFTLELFSDESDKPQGTVTFSAALYLGNGEEHADAGYKNQQQASKSVYEQAKKLKVQIWTSVVNVVVIEGKNLRDKDGNYLSKPYLRLRLGNEKYKCKTATRIESNTTVTWMEQFDLHLYENQTHPASHLLEIFLFQRTATLKEEMIARTQVDLTSLEGEKTHSVSCEMQNGGTGTLALLVTISGTNASETISDLSTDLAASQAQEIEAVQRRYALLKTFQNIRDIGHLWVKVFRATGLPSADIGGKSDPFCVLQLVNARLQTQTEYKTLNPVWNKIFTFNVKDINSVLEVTVYDEDKDHRFEFLGTVSIPLLRIHNGQKRWYVLKERKLRARAKGNNPQIQLELNVVWNEFRASIRTLNPKEKKYIEPEVKFNRRLFVRNVMRIKGFVLEAVEAAKLLDSCFEWESKLRSSVAFFIFLVVVWVFELWMCPVGLLFYFLRNYLVRSLARHEPNEYDSEGSGDEDEDEDGKSKDKQEEKKGFKETLQLVQEATLTVQNAIGFMASSVESVKNTFNFTVPFLSYLAIVLLLAATLLLYAIPLRYLILAWGVNKFTRKLLRPHTIPNNELMDFLSRVPDDEQLVEFRELRAVEPPGDNHHTIRRATKKK